MSWDLVVANSFDFFQRESLLEVVAGIHYDFLFHQENATEWVAEK